MKACTISNHSNDALKGKGPPEKIDLSPVEQKIDAILKAAGKVQMLLNEINTKGK